MIRESLKTQGGFFQTERDWMDKSHLVKVNLSDIRSGDKLILKFRSETHNKFVFAKVDILNVQVVGIKVRITEIIFNSFYNDLEFHSVGSEVSCPISSEFFKVSEGWLKYKHRRIHNPTRKM